MSKTQSATIFFYVPVQAQDEDIFQKRNQKNNPKLNQNSPEQRPSSKKQMKPMSYKI